MSKVTKIPKPVQVPANQPVINVAVPVTLIFPPDMLNVLLAGLEQMPYKLAKPVVESIHSQVVAQLTKKPDTPGGPSV